MSTFLYHGIANHIARVTLALMAMLLATLPLETVLAQTSAEDEVVGLLAQEAPFHVVPPQLFETLGWDLPDGGASVKALADATPGGALDPRDLESIPAAPPSGKSQPSDSNN